MTRILIVDSDSQALQATARAFKAYPNVELETATSGNSAVAKLANENKFCLVISENRLKDGSGLELLKYTSASHQNTLFAIFTDKVNFSVTIDNPNYLGTFTKPELDFLVQESMLAIRMGPNYFRQFCKKS